MRKTKIVCTIGPASESKEMLIGLCKAGMNVARLNFSHGTHEDHQMRIERIKEVREELRLPIAILLDTKGPEVRVKTFKEGSAFLENGSEFTALFTASDVMAVGAIRALHEKGLKVPQDVSVIGFDGLEVGSYLVPKLSSVVQPAQMMAQRSVEILISRIEGEAGAIHETVPFELWERESVTVPKK
jgi:DNA-binding LacI/PurR family transcriptional regulator